MSHRGITFDSSLDEVRLNEQSVRVYRLMRDQDWRSLGEISGETGDPEASISARLRDFRKAEYGGFVMNRRRRVGAMAGLWEYQLQPAGAAVTPPKLKSGRNPFLEGLKFAAKTVLKAGDFHSAKAALAVELRKAASR
ncbi:hypothetical protein LP414_27365 [Polaromonas sp. P1(28)-13]|nr:hypothetical protein LP414_27365 [Polaromonas sp. P1(28)-13]